METSNKLGLLYAFLEDLNSVDEWEILSNFPVLENLSETIQEKVTIERKALCFSINDGVLKTNVNLTDIKGKIIKEPFFNTNEIIYLKERLEKTNNLIMKAKYSHIIWQETKDKLFGIKAVDLYFDLLNKKLEKEFNQILKIISCILYISCKIKYKENDFKSALVQIALFSSNWQKSLLLNLFVKLNCFKISELKELVLDIPNWINEDYFSNKQNLSLGIVLYKKLNLSNEKLFLLLAQNEDLIINEKTDADFVKLTSYGQKCVYLKNAKCDDEYKKCLAKYNLLKQTVNLGSVQFTLDEELNLLFNKHIEKRVDFILKHSTAEILAIFSSEESILVNPTENKKNAEKTFNNSFQKLCSVTTLDINLNYKELNENQKLENQIYQNYTIGLQVTFFVLFIKVFRKGILEGYFTFQKIYDYLDKYTWYGHKFERVLRNNDIDKSTDWITLIAPGLHNFFTQYELTMLLSTNRVNNYVLALDSLTIKFEGAIRDFIKLCGGSTSKATKNDLLEEQLLEELIENNKIKELFSESDIELFKFTFTRKGKNIRNNIAHSFYSYSNYSFENVALVFLCFMRLGKYSLSSSEKSI
jgi:hypothetical protein